jgi:hypothetical protein
MSLNLMLFLISMLDKVRAVTISKGGATDPYSDDTSAAFYRLPAGFRRAKKYQDKEDAGKWTLQLL